MPRDRWGDEGRRGEHGYRGDERRDYWSEGESISSEPRDRERGGAERYAGTRDMDFGGGYGGGRERGGGSWDERGGGRGRLAGTRDMDDRWDRERWDRDRAGSRGSYGGGSYGSSGGGSYGGGSDRGYGSYGTYGSNEDWRRSSDDRWGEGRRGESRSYGEQGPGGGYPGGWGGTSGYGSSTGGYGATGLTGSTGWGRGGAGYSGDFGRGFSGGGGGFGGGGSYGGGRYGRGGQESYGSMYPSYGAEFGAQSWRGESRWGDDDQRWGRRDERWGSDDQRWGSREHEGRGLMERMGDTFREGMARLTGRGPKGYKRSDERIREDVCERIARSSVNAENVEVQVESGEVTLTGEVDNRMDKRRLEDMIEDIFGVDEVHNNLRMHRETQATTTTSAASTGESRGDDSGVSHH